MTFNNYHLTFLIQSIFFFKLLPVGVVSLVCSILSGAPVYFLFALFAFSTAYPTAPRPMCISLANCALDSIEVQEHPHEIIIKAPEGFFLYSYGLIQGLWLEKNPNGLVREAGAICYLVFGDAMHNADWILSTMNGVCLKVVESLCKQQCRGKKHPPTHLCMAWLKEQHTSVFTTMAFLRLAVLHRLVCSMMPLLPETGMLCRVFLFFFFFIYLFIYFIFWRGYAIQYFVLTTCIVFSGFP